jgi:hypothetical protein
VWRWRSSRASSPSRISTPSGIGDTSALLLLPAFFLPFFLSLLLLFFLLGAVFVGETRGDTRRRTS